LILSASTVPTWRVAPASANRLSAIARRSVDRCTAADKPRRIKILGVSTTFRWERAAQQVDRWLVVTTSLDGEGPELAQLIQELLGVVENDPELAGFEIQTARQV
jgi:hypothetical protein